MAIRKTFAIAVAVALALPFAAVVPSQADAQQVMTHRQLVKQLRVGPGPVAVDPRIQKRLAPRVKMRAPEPDGGRVVLRRAPQPEAPGVVIRRAPQPQGPPVATMRAPEAAPPAAKRRAPKPEVAEMRAPEPKAGKKAAARPPKAKQIAVAEARETATGKRGLQVKLLPRVEKVEEDTFAAQSYPQTGRVDLEILFEYDSDRIDPKSVKQLIELGEALNDPELGDGAFLVAGHTDAAGSTGYNDDLSMRRARAVTEFLVSYAGVDEGRLQAEGFGEELLKYPDAPESGQNRRVEIINLGAL